VQIFTGSIHTGKERREINNILNVEIFLSLKYKDKFKSLFFEEISFEEQVRYFDSAKLIVCAHGAVMSNMFFCKEGTKIIEVTCGAHFKFFDIISKILKLNHIKCDENNSEAIINVLKKM
jgi:capsular polysaccharide biosynthesis protein